MGHFVKEQVIMLPTEDKSRLGFFTDPKDTRLYFNGIPTPLSQLFSAWVPQHLYVISDAEIKEGDLKICLNDNLITTYLSKESIESDTKCKDCKKITATSDESLKIETRCFYDANDVDVVLVPQVSQQFIMDFAESYSKGDIITDILVEYELDFSCDIDKTNLEIWKSSKKLIVNPKDNTITIKR